MKSILIGISVGLLVAVITIAVTDYKWMKEAVKHGAASFYLDENGERWWGWNDDLAKGVKR